MTIAPKDGMDIPARYWAMLTVCFGITLAVLDGSIANVALPTIAHDLHANQPVRFGSSTPISWRWRSRCCRSRRWAM